MKGFLLPVGTAGVVGVHPARVQLRQVDSEPSNWTKKKTLKKCEKRMFEWLLKLHVRSTGYFHIAQIKKYSKDKLWQVLG